MSPSCHEIVNQLPPHFQRWLVSWLNTRPDFTTWFESLGHKSARHIDCVSCSRSLANWQRSPRVKANLKCCTFQPFVPNFMVGELLVSTKLQAQDLENGRSIPLGLVASPNYLRDFERLSVAPQYFGNEPQLLCSHFEPTNGQCRIWQARPAVCATYFCDAESSGHSCTKERATDRQKASEASFDWPRLEQFLYYVEVNLAHHVLLELGFVDDELQSNLDYLKQQSVHREQGMSSVRNSHDDCVDRIWYEFDQIKSGFFIKAANHVSSMSPAEIWEAIEPELLNF